MKKLSYLYHIDTLRAIAVLLVILFHLEIKLFNGGFIGVDVFFVISGFLITRLLRHEFLETGKISFKNFYLKRVRRLIPTLYLVIILAFIFTYLTFSPSDFINATNSMFKSSIALSNFHFLEESDYFNTSSNFKPLLHTWSLGIEEQFYLLYPITFFLLMKFFSKNKKGLIISLLGILILSICYTVYTSTIGISDKFHDLLMPKRYASAELSSIHFFMLPFRIFEFLIGSIAALMGSFKIKSELSKLTINSLGLILIIGSSIAFSKDTLYLSTLNILPCLGVFFLVYFPLSKHLAILFDNKVFIYIGKISYTLYLVHWLIIVIYRYIVDRGFNIQDKIGLFIVTLIVSAVIYKYYENPLRYTKAKFSIKSNTALTASVIAGILIIYAGKTFVNRTNGALWRLDNNQKKLLAKIGVPKDYNKNNWGGASYKVGWVEKKVKDGTDPDIILIGDSHVAHYLYGLDSIFVKKHNKNIFITNWATTLKLPDIIRYDKEGSEKKSKDYFEDILTLIKKYKNSIIIVSHSWKGGVGRSRVLNNSTMKYEPFPEDSTKFLLLSQKIKKFHNMIGADRKLLVLGSCSPRRNSNGLNFIEKIFRPKYLSKYKSESINFNTANSTYKIDPFESQLNMSFEKQFSTVENITFINPSDFFCNNGLCFEKEGSQIYFSDASHLSKEGSLKAVKHMEDRLIHILENEGK